MMELTSDIVQMKSAAIGAEIQTAVAAKVLDTTSALQEDLVRQLFAASGIGSRIGTEA
ncbi:MAG: hypothetical protein PHD35_11100 [Synergistaceae bacterium]|nr:hypothetical protein [Synergistaceae bacterium]